MLVTLAAGGTGAAAGGDTSAAAEHQRASAATVEQVAMAGPGAPMSCTPKERREMLAEDQRALLEKLGDLVVLRDEADLARLAALGFDAFPHWQTSLTGVGWTVADLEAIMAQTPGKPGRLNYRPAGGSNGPHDGYDFPFVLAGWTYLAPYDVAQHPASLLPCVDRAEWFVHERGIHRYEDGGFDPVPPAEQRYGTAAGATSPAAQPPNYGHPRSWDVHVWLRRSGVPTISVVNPGRPIPGLDVPPGNIPPPPAP